MKHRGVEKGGYSLSRNLKHPQNCVVSMITACLFEGLSIKQTPILGPIWSGDGRAHPTRRSYPSFGIDPSTLIPEGTWLFPLSYNGIPRQIP